MIDKFFHSRPHLKPVRIYNLYNRFLKASNNDMIIVFNKARDRYEIHSLRSFKYNRESLNVVLPDDMINSWTITDYRANNIRKFGQEVEAERYINDVTLDLYSDKGYELLQERALKTVEKMIGRDL